MTLNEAMKWVRTWEHSPGDSAAFEALTAEILRLQSEVTALRLYATARRAQPTVKTAPIAPTNWPAWGVIDETDAEFAERAGRQVAEVAR